MGQDCKYCGAYISGREDSCPACGKKIKGNSGYAAEAAQERDAEYRGAGSGEKTYTYRDEYGRRYGAERTGEGERKTYAPVSSSRSSDEKTIQAMAYLCYLGPLFLIPYFLRRDSDFIRFHSNQGLMLLLAEVIISACDIIPIVGGLINLAGSIFVIVCLVKGLMNVSKGMKERLPIIGEIEILK